MKKTYINPSMDIYELKVSHQLLAGSDIATGNAFQSGDPVLSRDVDFYEDEDF